MECIFYKCYELKSLDLSNWHVSNCEKKNMMFYDCPLVGKYRQDGEKLLVLTK